MDNEYIEKEIDIDDRKISARYFPESGEFEFSTNQGFGTTYSGLTHIGAFRTMKKLTEAFKEVDMPKISYSTNGKDLREAVIKDKLYARTLKRLGYREKQQKSFLDGLRLMMGSLLKKTGLNYHSTPPGFKYVKSIREWKSPNRTFVRPESSQGSLEKTLLSTMAVLGLLGSLIFLGLNITGNAIVNLTNNTSSLIGGALFLIGIICSYFWFKKK